MNLIFTNGSRVTHSSLALSVSFAFCLLPFALAEDDATKAAAAMVEQVPQADKEGKDGRFTGPEPETARKGYDELLKHGKGSVTALVGMLDKPGENYKARYVLHGLVTYVNRPDAEPDRKMVCDALLSTLGGATPKGVQEYVLEELKYLGRKDMADALGVHLADDALCEPAAQALLAIGNTSETFRKALPAAAGKNRLTIIQALGVQRDPKAVDEIKKALTDANHDIRIAACDALGNIGDPSSIDALLAAANAAQDHDRVKITEAALVLGTRLLEAGNTKDAERIYKRLWDTRTDRAERQVRCAALQGLVAARGELSDVLAAMHTGDPDIRSVAMRSAISILGAEATPKLVEALARAAPAERADLLAILGTRRDPVALAAVLETLKDTDAAVRASAMQAASAIGGEQAARAILAIAAAGSGKERDAALNALSNMRGKEANAIVGAAAREAQVAALRAALYGVLAARHADDQSEVIMQGMADKDKTLRLAALKALAVLANDAQLAAVVKVLKESGDAEELKAAEAGLAAACARRADACASLAAKALNGAAPGNAAALVRVLGAAGTPKALETVVAQTRSANADLKDAAVRTLSEWREKEAAAPLLEVVQTTDNLTQQVLAVRGIIRLLDKGLNNAEKLKLLDGVLNASRRPDEKRQALAGLGNMQGAEALNRAAACLDDAAVAEEAAVAVVKIAEPLSKKNPDTVRGPLTKAAKAAKNEAVRANAERLLKDIKMP